MASYIADSINIIFQRTKNILLQDIINIAYFMLKVNVLLPLQDAFRTIDWIKIKKRLVNLEPIVNKNSGFIDIKLPSRC